MLLRSIGGLFHTADSGAAGGGTGAPPSDGFQRLLERHQSDALRMAETLYRDNYDARERARQLQTELESLRQQLPGDDALILRGDDRSAYDAYRALGDLPALQQRIAERDTLASELATIQRRDTVRTAADAHGYDSEVLAELARDLTIIIKEQGEGKDRKRVAYVQDGDKETPLPRYAEQRWAKFLPALTTQAAPPSIGTPRTGNRPATPNTEVGTPRVTF